MIILASLFKQIDTTAATGLPRTTCNHLSTAFLISGEDQITNKTEEMIILIAPTVIEPDIGHKSPHTALDKNDVVKQNKWLWQHHKANGFR